MALFLAISAGVLLWLGVGAAFLYYLGKLVSYDWDSLS